MPDLSGFIQGFWTSLDIISQMALLVLLGYAMIRRGWMLQDTLSDLTAFLIDIVIPCAFILAMTRSFSMELLEEGILLAGMSAGWILLAGLIGLLLYRFVPAGSRQEKDAVTAMMMISNSIFLPLPVILAVTPEPLRDRAVVLISIVSLPSMLFMWTLGVKLLGGQGGMSAKDRLKRIFNPPIVSFFIGILLSLIPGVRESARGEPGGTGVLAAVFSSMDFLGRMLSPMAMIILGGMIASARCRTRIRAVHVIPLALVRLILVPGLVYSLIALKVFSFSPPGAVVLVLVAAAPPATNHTLIARRYGGEWELVASLQLVVHLIALLTLPLWLSGAMGLD